MGDLKGDPRLENYTHVGDAGPPFSREGHIESPLSRAHRACGTLQSSLLDSLHCGGPVAALQVIKVLKS